MLNPKALTHDHEDENYVRILNARPMDFGMGYFDPFLFQEPQYGDSEPLGSDFPIQDLGIPSLNQDSNVLKQDSNGVYSETESLLRQADEIDKLPLSDESLRDTEYHCTLIKQVNKQYYDRKIGETKFRRARLNDLRVKSCCDLGKPRTIVAARERERRIENQPAQDAGSTPGPLVVHGEADLRL